MNLDPHDWWQAAWHLWRFIFLHQGRHKDTLSMWERGEGGVVVLFPHAEQLKETGLWIRTGPPNHLTGHRCPLESGAHTRTTIFLLLYINTFSGNSSSRIVSLCGCDCYFINIHFLKILLFDGIWGKTSCFDHVLCHDRIFMSGLSHSTCRELMQHLFYTFSGLFLGVLYIRFGCNFTKWL